MISDVHTSVEKVSTFEHTQYQLALVLGISKKIHTSLVLVLDLLKKFLTSWVLYLIFFRLSYQPGPGIGSKGDFWLA